MAVLLPGFRFASSGLQGRVCAGFVARMQAAGRNPGRVLRKAMTVLLPGFPPKVTSFGAHPGYKCGHPGCGGFALYEPRGLTQCQQRRLRGLIQYFKKRLSSPCRATLALFPITNGIERDIDPLRELQLGQTQSFAHPARKVLSTGVDGDASIRFTPSINSPISAPLLVQIVSKQPSPARVSPWT